MKTGFRQSMAWLHTWSGLLVGWVLFLIFLTGTASYFRPEISFWARPELHRPQAEVASLQPVLDAALRMSGGNDLTLTLPNPRLSLASAFWRDPTASGRGFRTALLDPVSGEALKARETRGGDFFFRLHFDLHYMSPIWARWIVGLCSMFMLVAIVSGIITHRRIFSDFFTFRPRKGQRSWLDAHAVTAVLALPYHLMITYTGLITLMPLYMPWGVQAAYRDDPRTFTAEVFGSQPPVRRSGQAAPLVAIDPILAEAARLWEGGRVARVTIRNPGDAEARIDINRGDDDRLAASRQSLVFHGVSGALLDRDDRDSGTALTHGAFYSLHVGRFAEGALRWLFFLSGLAGTAMVGTGVLLWAVKERQEHRKAGRVGPGLRLVEVLNLATLAGLPVAMAGFFWLNRLLPAEMPGRSGWETDGFFILWGLCLLHALCRPGLRGWIEQLSLAGALGLLLPVASALTVPSHLGASLTRGPATVAAVELTVAALGALMLGGAVYLARRKAPLPRAARGAAKPAARPAE